jgi:hypothetical protein
MSDLRRKEAAAPRKDKHKPTRVKPDTVSWGRELARRAKVAYDEDEFDDMRAGEADTRDEAAGERHAADEALRQFQDVNEECEELERQLNALVGPGALPGTFIAREVVLITGLRDATANDLQLSHPDSARNRLPQLQQALADAADAASVRDKMNALVEEQTERFRSAPNLTDRDVAALEAQRTLALHAINADGGWDWEAWEAPLELRTQVDQALEAARQQEQARMEEEDRRANAARQAEAEQRAEQARRAEAERLAAKASEPGVVVGGPGLGPMMLAGVHFDPAHEEALAVLNALKDSGQKFASRQEIVAEVAKNPAVAAAMARAAEARRQREAEQAAQDERERVQREQRARSPVVYEFDIRQVRGSKRIKVTEHDIVNGRWERLEERQNPDYGLFLTIDGEDISFHLHQPRFDGNPPLPGGFKCRGINPGLSQTPDVLIPVIMRLKKWPGEWGAKPKDK